MDEDLGRDAAAAAARALVDENWRSCPEGYRDYLHGRFEPVIRAGIEFALREQRRRLISRAGQGCRN